MTAYSVNYSHETRREVSRLGLALNMDEEAVYGFALELASDVIRSLFANSSSDGIRITHEHFAQRVARWDGKYEPMNTR